MMKLPLTGRMQFCPFTTHYQRIMEVKGVDKGFCRSSGNETEKKIISYCWSILTIMLEIGESAGPPLAGNGRVHVAVPKPHFLYLLATTSG